MPTPASMLLDRKSIVYRGNRRGGHEIVSAESAELDRRSAARMGTGVTA